MKRALEYGKSTVAVLGIGTALAPHRLEQDDAALRLADALGGNANSARWAKKIFKHCGVETRYTCEPNLLETADGCRYVYSSSLDNTPSTAERMKMFKEHSVPIGMEAARKALQDSNINYADITHLITVSCTGFFLPGIDVALIQELELAADIIRIPLNFLGCAAGLTAVRMSKEIVKGNPDAKVLIVCVELCTLHIQPSSDRDDIYAAAFFGDGASACVVGNPGLQRKGLFALSSNRTVIFPGTTDEMVWNVGNLGFSLYLSPRIPKLIGEHIPKEIERLLGSESLPELWAIHPGGRGIIDTLQATYSLTDEQINASRSVLRQYGNLSSATILFVLDKMKRDYENRIESTKEGIALAFGPGLNAEIMRFTYVPFTVLQYSS